MRFCLTALMLTGSLAMLGCPPISHDSVYKGSAATGDDDDNVADACQQLCDEMCECEGVDEAFEAAGLGDCQTYCEDTYASVGDNDVCLAALEAFYAGGGCDQYTPLGDDDTVD